MRSDRRDIVKSGAAVGIGWAVGGAVRAADPVVGLIFPPLDYPVPPEARLLYPAGVTFLARGIGLPGGMTVAAYEEALPRIFPAALALKAAGAQGISVMGTSLTFYKGAAFNEEIKRRVAAETGLAATTMSSGIVAGLRIAGARRVSIVTAYTDDITGRLGIFLEEHGFRAVAARGMGYVGRFPPEAVTHDRLIAYCTDAYRAGPVADALVISCGGLKTIDLIGPLEARLGVPVVSSTPHALMDAVRLVGLSGRAPGWGKVLAGA